MKKLFCLPNSDMTWCCNLEKNSLYKFRSSLSEKKKIIRRLGYDKAIFIILKACVLYFSLFLKDKCISSLVRTKYIEKKFTSQLFFFLPTVSRTFILSWATTRYPPLWNFLFSKNNFMCNRDNARDAAACPDE